MKPSGPGVERSRAPVHQTVTQSLFTFIKPFKDKRKLRTARIVIDFQFHDSRACPARQSRPSVMK